MEMLKSSELGDYVEWTLNIQSVLSFTVYYLDHLSRVSKSVYGFPCEELTAGSFEVYGCLNI